MREYKFRGQTISGAWVYGLLAYRNGSPYISNKAGSPFAYLVRPETVGEHTGLKDTNGVEIYEGDIFEDDEDGSVNWVEYDVDYAGFTTTDGKGSGWWTPKDLVDAVAIYEVIGNIYENPELLYKKGSV